MVSEYEFPDDNYNGYYLIHFTGETDREDASNSRPDIPLCQNCRYCVCQCDVHTVCAYPSKPHPGSSCAFISLVLLSQSDIIYLTIEAVPIDGLLIVVQERRDHGRVEAVR